VKIAVIAGSGLQALTGRLGGEPVPWDPPTGARPAAPGHRMEVTEGSLGGVPALAFGGRLHYYQGYSMAEVAQTVVHAHAWGADVLFVTNASGSLRTEIAAGEVGVIRDHINLMPDNPLRGTTEFLDLSEAYDAPLRGLLAAEAVARGIRVPEVVYAGMPGPTFETPAEVRMLRMLGADVAGMSTVAEVIMARRFGMRVLALTVVTNRAGAPASAEHVLQAAGGRAADVADLLEGVATRLAAQ
jgi:inosine/guanosine/xanthosine phosphorylase family protein